MNFKDASEFTMRDASGGYGWMDDGINTAIVNEIGVESFVRSYVKTVIAGTTYESGASDKTVYKMWRAGNEFSQVCNYVREFIS